MHYISGKSFHSAPAQPAVRYLVEQTILHSSFLAKDEAMQILLSSVILTTQNISEKPIMVLYLYRAHVT